MKTAKLPGIWGKIFDFLSSLKLAVAVLLALVVSLATGTIIESLYDTPTAQYWVYQSLWFHAILGALAVNLFVVMLSRLPWKWRHAPFLMAHIGILVLLLGAWVTERVGVDGMLRVTEGNTESVVEMDGSPQLVFTDQNFSVIPIRWMPPNAGFEPIALRSLGFPHDLTIDQYLSHADAELSFVPKTDTVSKDGAFPALKIRITGGPMRITQDLWLWTGDPSTRVVQAGPARFFLGDQPASGAKRGSRQAGPEFRVRESGKDLTYTALSSGGKLFRGKVEIRKIARGGYEINPGWRGGVRIRLMEWIPKALPLSHYFPARVQYGNEAPYSAIHLSYRESAGAPVSGVWLGYGERTALRIDGKEIEIGYLPRRVVLPFSLRLDRFQIDRYEGTMDPASYFSKVTVVGGLSGPQKNVTISMNEPLELEGFTVYQSSYEDAFPRPTTSIFSVNRDPGRPWKYLGSLLIVLGTILLFAMKYRKSKPRKKNQGEPGERLASEVVGL